MAVEPLSPLHATQLFEVGSHTGVAPLVQSALVLHPQVPAGVHTGVAPMQLPMFVGEHWVHCPVS